MTNHSPLSPRELPLALAAELDRICDRFAAEWAAGRRPKAEDYLAGVAETLRSSLLGELLRVELEARRKAGETPTPDEFLGRFPAEARTIDAAFQPTIVTDLEPVEPTEPERGAPGERGRRLGEGAERFGRHGYPALAPGATTNLMLALVARLVRDDEAEEGAETVDTDDREQAAASDETDHAVGPKGSGAACDDRPAIAGYDVLERLGSGGMGVVYKARHRGLNRLVALKMIRADKLTPADGLTRLRVEADAVARLCHPNILQIYDIGEADRLPFVALELLDGGRLDHRLAGTPQPPRQAAELLITLARAVQVAHDAGIVHRDLKPSNVLYNSDGVPKIADFGLAKRVDSDDGQTPSGLIMGSPSYMAPEQARGQSRAVGPAADVYALGAILYEMLTGRPPFKGETPMETMRQVLDDDPVAPSGLVPRVPRDIETIALKCLHKDPARRYESAQALADDLHHYLRGEPIRARRTPAWERGVKWARRRPLVAASWVFSGVLVFGGALAAAAWERSARFRAEWQAKWNQEQQEIGSRLIDQARGASVLEQLEQLDDAKVALAKLGVEIRQAHGLEGLRARIDASLRIVETRINEIKAREAKLADARQEDERFRKFRALVTETFFHDTEFTGLDLASNRALTRRAALAGLDLYAAPGREDSWVLRPLPASVTQQDQAEIAEGCYELLLILAQTEPTPEQGLRRLEQTARLRPPTRAYHERKADYLARLGDAASADRERHAADRVEPATASEHFLAGHERFKRGEPIGAIRAFNDALRLQPDHFWAQCLSAICWLQLKRPVEAGAGLNACLKRDPEFAWLYILRGFAAGLIPPGAGPEEVATRFEAADADYERARRLLEQKPNDELQYILLVNRGLLRFQRDRLDLAAADLRAAIALDDRSSQAYAALAEVHRKQRRPDEAITQFDRAIERKPDYAPLYRARADVNLARKDPAPAQRAQALADLEHAIRLEKPDNPVLARDLTNRGKLLALDHRDAEALAAWDAALELVPDYPEAHHRRLQLLRHRKRYDEVIRSCDALVAREKATPEIYELRGLARAELKNFAGAIEDVTSALGRCPNKAALLCRRGWLYVVAEAPRLALHDFEAAIRLDPALGDAYNGRGYVRLLRLGEHRDAVADAEKALGLAEPNAHVLYNAARVYALASVVASAEIREKGREAATLVARYQDRAAKLLGEVLQAMPESDRASFWRDVVHADPALRAISRRVSSAAGSGDAQKSSLAHPLPLGEVPTGRGG
jgi:tetratricopeptide (TPR) repeat protein